MQRYLPTIVPTEGDRKCLANVAQLSVSWRFPRDLFVDFIKILQM